MSLRKKKRKLRTPSVDAAIERKEPTNTHGVRIGEISSVHKTFEESAIPDDITPEDVADWKVQIKESEAKEDLIGYRRPLDVSMCKCWYASRARRLVDKDGKRRVSDAHIEETVKRISREGFYDPKGTWKWASMIFAHLDSDSQPLAEPFDKYFQ